MAKYAATGDGMFDGYLEPEMAQDYFAEIEKTSIVQQVARKIPLGPTGVHIPHWDGNVSASWVGEGEEKPVTKGDMGMKTVKPHKIATIFAASAEVVRANPNNYMSTMRTKVAEAIALAFDAAVLRGEDSPFDHYIEQTSKSQGIKGNTYLGVNAALQDLVDDDKKMTGILLDDKAEPIINGAVDATGRPLFLEANYTDMNAPFRQGRILGRNTVLSDHVANGNVLGYAGDWDEIVWGQIGGLTYDVTDQASLDFGEGLVSLWQHNLVAVRVETEFGLLINDKDAFVKLTKDDAPEGAGSGEG